jgi:PAS domain S-box-containing protein
MEAPTKHSRTLRLRGWLSARFGRIPGGQTQPPEEQATSRRSRGWFSSRLSDKSKGGRHRTFRGVPDFFRLAVESLNEYALITMDRNRVISSWSGPAAAMFGYTEAEIIGQNVTLLFTPEDIAKGIDKQEFVEALDKGRQDDERWHVCKDGRRLWCYGLSFPLKDENDEVRGFVKLIRDDTVRKKKDELLRDSEERLRLAGDSTGLGTWDYDVAKKSMTISKRAAELFNLGNNPKAVDFEQFLKVIHPEDRPIVAEKFKCCLTSAAAYDGDMEFRVPMVTGRIRWVLAKARAFVDDPGQQHAQADRLIGTVIDVTERRRKETEAQDLKQELETKVKERTSRLTEVHKELETFAYSASHDLRAPLRKIAAFSHAVIKSAEGKLNTEEQSYLDIIREAADKMQGLIDDQLKLARVTRKPLAYVDCDLSRIARDAIDELQKSEPERKVEIVIAADARTRGDRELLAIALQNLFANAWKFTSKHPTARIEFGVTTIGDKPAYFVRDDGAGFDIEFAHKLFGTFQRLHPEEEFPGTGVGLGLVARIIRRHHGRVWAEGAVEKGATFFFTVDTEA